MLCLYNYYNIEEWLGCKEGTSLGVYEWDYEGITEVTMLSFIEDSLEFSSLGIFEWYFEVVK